MEYKLMLKLHFSKGAINCYKSLFEEGPTTASVLANRLNRQRTGLYRDLEQLESKGFVLHHRSDESVTYFYPIPVRDALDRLAMIQRQSLGPLIRSQTIIRSSYYPAV